MGQTGGSPCLWLDTPVLLNNLKGRGFCDLFKGFATVAVNRIDHKTYCAGQDLSSLAECISDHGEKVENFYMIPGPGEFVQP